MFNRISNGPFNIKAILIELPKFLHLNITVLSKEFAKGKKQAMDED